MTTLVTAAQLAQLRRMVAEPTPTTYSDALITTMIENHALLDQQGEEPYELDESVPPELDVNPEWMPTYDLNAAAADVWEEKSSTLIGAGTSMDFSADGSSFRKSQIVEQYTERARYYRSRVSSKTATLHKWPLETTANDFPWIVNLPEDV